MPTIDRHGRWHDERGRFMHIGGALIAAAKAADKPGGKSAKPRSLTKAGATLRGLSTDEHAATLEAMTSRDDARAHVANIKGTALTDLAKHYKTRGTVAEKREAIVESAVGARLSGEHMRSGYEVFKRHTEPGLTPSPHIDIATSSRDLPGGDTDVMRGRNLTAPGRAALDALGPGGHPDLAAIHDPEAKIRQAYQMLARPGGHVGFEDLRQIIGNQSSRREVDEALRRMHRQSDVNITPQSYSRFIDPEARMAASIRLGDQEQNMIQIDMAPTSRHEDLNGKSAAQLRDIAATEGIPVRQRDNAAKTAQTIRDFRDKRDSSTGTTVFAAPATGGRNQPTVYEAPPTLADAYAAVKTRAGAAIRDPSVPGMTAFARAGGDINGASIAPGVKATPKVLTTAEHRAALVAMATLDEARAYLAGLRGKALTDLARSMGITGTVANMRRMLLESTVGRRLDSEAIGGINGRARWTDDLRATHASPMTKVGAKLAAAAANSAGTSGQR